MLFVDHFVDLEATFGDKVVKSKLCRQYAQFIRFIALHPE
jgi:hypothetical protein